MAVSGDEVRRSLEAVRDTTKNPEVRRVMERALELYKEQSGARFVDPRLSSAASELLTEMAKSKRVERVLLWLGPVAALAATSVLFAALGNFLSRL